MLQKGKNDWWFIVALYMGLIYSTSGLAVQVWDAFDSTFKGYGSLVVYIIAFTMAVFAALYVLRFRKDRNYLHYVTLIGSFSILWFMVVHAKYSAEKVHLIEFGILGALVYRALLHHTSSSLFIFISGSVICSILGLLDEVVQFYMPGRVFDPQDVLMNIVSSVLTLLVMIICFKSDPGVEGSND